MLTAVAPGRFAASINQAPMRWRWRTPLLLWLDFAMHPATGRLVVAGWEASGDAAERVTAVSAF